MVTARAPAADGTQVSAPVDPLLPIATPGGPACPVCGAALRYVQTVIVRAEHRLVGAEVDRDVPSQVFVMPVADPEPDQEDIVEHLASMVECAGLDCGYRIPAEVTGEVDWA